MRRRIRSPRRRPVLGVAAAAARAFGRRRLRTPGLGRPAWHPLALRWRRAARRLAGASGALPPRMVFNTWLAAIHLRFNTLIAAAQRVRRRVEPRTGVAAKALAQSRPRGELRRRPAPLQTHPATQPIAAHRARQKLRWPRATGVAAGALQNRISLQQREHVLAGAPQRHRQSRRTGGRVAETSARTPAGAAAGVAFHWRSQIARTAAGDRQEQHRRPRLKELAAPVTLIWRKPTGAVEVPEAGRVLRSPVVHARAGEPAAGRVAHGNAATPTGIKIAAAAAVLEPAVVERLTDDVVRRVERRVRIERERRGL